jgi:hypothetical protein
LGAALLLRQPTFLSEEAWKTVPWMAGTSTKDLLDHLLDLAVEIPTVLAMADELGGVDPAAGTGEPSGPQQRLWDYVADLTRRFEQWKTDWADRHPGGPPREVESPGDEGELERFPIFHCRDQKTMQVMQPLSIVYPDLRLAQSTCLYWAFRIVLSTGDTRPEGALTMWDKYHMACNIARGLEGYIRRAPGNMINRLVLPVRVAWEVFPPRGVEREFIKAVFVLVDRRHSLRLWASSMPELSPRAGSPP